MARKSTNVYVQIMLHNVINCHHVSIALAIIGVALQEYNNLPHVISGTTQCNNVSKIEYFNLHTSLTALVMLP